MIVHKDKMMFRQCNKNLNTLEGQERQRHSDSYKKLRDNIGEKGMINPILCIKEDGIYKICVGMRRYIAGLELGMTKFNVKVLPSDHVKLLKEEIKKQIPTEVS